MVAGFTPQPGLALCEPHCGGDVLEEVQTTGNGNRHGCKAAMPEVPTCLHATDPVPNPPHGWGLGTW